MVSSDADTKEFSIATATKLEREAPSASVKVDIAACTHPGKKRPNNEDSYLVCQFQRHLNTISTNLPPELVPLPHNEVGYAMFVADGMGGAAGGEVASRTAISSLIDLVVRTPDWIFTQKEQWAQQVLRRMELRFEKVREILEQETLKDPRLTGMGTTMTVAGSIGRILLVAHLGDSRIYVYTHGQLIHLTKDQTMAQLLVDMGVISEKDALTHHARHVLTGAIAADAKSSDVELRIERLNDGDQLLLCSDGLTDMVSDMEIGAVLAKKQPAQKSCEELIELALQAGGKDNVTVVVAKYTIPDDH
jgi:protein phosphatase